MAVFRDIDYDLRVNGALTVSHLSTFNLGVKTPLINDSEDDNLTITGNATITGDLAVEGKIIGLDLSNYYTKADLQTSGMAKVHVGNIDGISNYARLDGQNVFTANTNSIRIRPSTDMSQQHTNEAVTFTGNTVTLAYKPVDALSETVKSDVNGTVIYKRDVDYSIHYPTGRISRTADSTIPEGATVYVDYTSTVNVFSIVNPTETETYYSIDNRGNVTAKSITVNLTSSFESGGGSAEGDFIVNGNLLVYGNTVLGDNNGDDNVAIMADLTLYDQDNVSVFSVDRSGNIKFAGTLSIGNERKDSKWDTAYEHSISQHAPIDAPSNAQFTAHTNNTTVHITSQERAAWNAAKEHADSDHAPVDAPSRAEFQDHIDDTSLHITAADRTRWNNKQDALGYTPLKNTSDTLTGTLTIVSNDGTALNIKAGDTSDHVYLSFFADSDSPNTRSGYIGYATAGTTNLTIANSMTGGNIILSPGASGEVRIDNNTVWHSGNFTPSNYISVNGGAINGNLTVTGTLSVGTLSTTNTNVVANLNADRLDNFHASDIMNVAMNSIGYGVITGCAVSGLGTQEGISVSAGRLYIKDYGVYTYPGQAAITSGFTRSNYHIVFIAGRTEGNYVLGNVGIISAATKAAADQAFSSLTNPIKLAEIPPYNKSTIANSDIYSTRKFVSILSEGESISILRSDRDNVLVSSGQYQTVDRVLIDRSGINTRVTIQDPRVQNQAGTSVTRSLELKTDTITFREESSSATITAQKITNWDDANTKKHVHIYDAPFTGPTTGAGDREYIVINNYIPLPEKTRVYKNGLRLKRNSSASAWDNDYWQEGNLIIFSDHVIYGNTGPEEYKNDVIVVDFDL